MKPPFSYGHGPQEHLKTSADPSLVAFRQQCRDAARGLEQLVVDDLGVGPSSDPTDPTALLAEARRRDLGGSVFVTEKR